MDELAEWIKFHSKSAEQLANHPDALSSFNRQASLFHIANSRKICSTLNLE
jgi:hypothetical protein